MSHSLETNCRDNYGQLEAKVRIVIFGTNNLIIDIAEMWANDIIKSRSWAVRIGKQYGVSYPELRKAAKQAIANVETERV